MNGDEFSDRDILAMAVARMTKDGRQQDVIRRVLGIGSQAEVSRLLSHARQNSWLVTELRIPTAVAHRVETRVFRAWEALFEKLGSLARARGPVSLKGMHVIYSGSDGETEEQRFARFGRRGAGRIAELLRPAKTCAVAWGRTINSIVDGIRQLQPAGGWEGILFFPTSGEPINHRDTGVSASTAAARLAVHFHCTRPALSLSGIAARIPRGFSNSDQKSIRKFIDKCVDYRHIFAEDSGCMRSADAIVTGIGDATSSVRDPLFRETQELEDRTPDWLNDRCVGNLGGIWLAKKKDDRDVGEMNKRWSGIQEQDFERCGVRAAGEMTSDPPGVIVVAVGASKADILRRSLGKINHLVIDHGLAEELLK